MANEETVLIKQHETALDARQPKDGTERLKAYRWRPGQPSPNPKGRPKEDLMPLSNGYKRSLKMKIPTGHELRMTFQETTGCKLPAKATLGDFLAAMTVWKAVGKFPELNLKVMKEVREATEGREAPRAFEPRQENINADTGDELRERILLGLLGVIKRRSEIYGLKNTTMKELEEEALEFEKKAQ